MEICPTSNLNSGAVKNITELGGILRAFITAGVKFCINTDGAELNRTNIKREMRLLYENEILTEDELYQANEVAHAASFCKVSS